MIFTDVLLSEGRQTPRVHSLFEVQEQTKLICGGGGQNSACLGAKELLTGRTPKGDFWVLINVLNLVLEVLTQACVCIKNFF